MTFKETQQMLSDLLHLPIDTQTGSFWLKDNAGLPKVREDDHVVCLYLRLDADNAYNAQSWSYKLRFRLMAHRTATPEEGVKIGQAFMNMAQLAKEAQKLIEGQTWSTEEVLDFFKNVRHDDDDDAYDENDY